jgi:hypothetical protein
MIFMALVGLGSHTGNGENIGIKIREPSDY